MRPFWVRNIFYPVHEILRGRATLSILRELEKSQWYSYERLKELQWNKMKKLLFHAYEQVPYYRSLLDSMDMHPYDVKNVDDLKKIPLLTKEIIKDNFQSLIAENFRNKLIRNSTGGSSGEPLVFYTDKVKEASLNAAKLRARRWWGVDVGDRQIDIWGSPIELSKQDHIRFFKDRYFMNYILLSAFNLSKKSVDEYLKVMRHFQPVILYGYPTVLYQFARICEEKGINPDLSALKIIVTTSEMLYDYQREKIVEIFQRPVVNEYGCRDAGYITQECPEGNMHIAMEHVYIEFISPDKGSNEIRELVVTNLDGYGMPFIRYCLGDLSIKKNSKCACGRGLTLLDSIQGRSIDMITSPIGKLLHGISVVYVLKQIQSIRQFKVIQEKIDRLSIEIVKGPGYQYNEEKEIKRCLRMLMEAPVEIDILYRSHIAPEKSGKYRWVVSKLAENA